MTTYRLHKGDTLVFSVDFAPWQCIRFRRQDFADIDAATADEVAAVIQRDANLDAVVENGRLTLVSRSRKTLARPTRDGRVAITSPSIGPVSGLRVEPNRVAAGKSDAAPSLGFVGSAAHSQPCSSDSAALVCRGQATGVQAVNMTGRQIELHFTTGTVVLPPRVSMPVTPGQVAHPPLQQQSTT